MRVGGKNRVRHGMIAAWVLCVWAAPRWLLFFPRRVGLISLWCPTGTVRRYGYFLDQAGLPKQESNTENKLLKELLRLKEGCLRNSYCIRIF